MYLSGQELPSLYITYYRPGSHADQHVSVLASLLEAALQEAMFHPALSLPKVGGLAGGLGLHHLSQTAAPSGKSMFLDEELEQWIDAGGLQQLHAASHKVNPHAAHAVYPLASFLSCAGAATVAFIMCDSLLATVALLLCQSCAFFRLSH